MGMESVYKLSVILNLVDNLSGQMNGVQSSVSGSVDKLNSAFGTMQKAGVAMAGIGGTITGLATPFSIYHRRFFFFILTVSNYSILPSIAGGLDFSFKKSG